MIFALIIFIIILSALIFFHELGHFSTAKFFGIKVDEFGMGLPPKLFGKKYKGTEYTINALPLGGFVRIRGEDFEGYDPKDKHNFINKKPWQKTIVLFAGIFMNLVIAIGIFYAILISNGFKSAPLLLMGNYNFKFGNEMLLQNVITFVQDGTSAADAGMQFGDRIVSLSYNNETVSPTNVTELRDFVADKTGKEIIVETKNINSQDVNEYKITPAYLEEIKQPALGVALSDAVYIDYGQSFTDKVFAGFLHAANITAYSYHAMGELIGSSIQTKNIEPVSQGISGPVGIFGAVRSVIESDTPNKWATIFDLVAILSLSLGVMNFLPIPALDGGRIVFVAYEWITGKRPSQKLEGRAHQFGYLLLMGLLIVITVKDVFQLF